MRRMRQPVFVLVLVAVWLAFMTASGPAWHEARCLAVLPERDPAPGRIRLLSCSNLEQGFEAVDAVDRPTSAPGWSALSPAGERATVRLRLRKSTDRAVFYPRLGGPGAVITVNEAIGGLRRELLRLSREQEGWTPIGEQRSLCLACVENGWSDEEFTVLLEIELVGKGAQLWHKGDLVLF